MNVLETWRLDLDGIQAHLAKGIDLFGSYTDWLLVIPMFWAITLISLWAYMSRRQRRSDRAYLTYASRNLSLLRRLARQRADEVAFSRRTDRF